MREKERKRIRDLALDRNKCFTKLYRNFAYFANLQQGRAADIIARRLSYSPEVEQRWVIFQSAWCARVNLDRERRFGCMDHLVML